MAVTQPWHCIRVRPGAEKDCIAAEAVAAAGSSWFDGHFPGAPILPGIAMLAAVFDAVKQEEAHSGLRLRLTAIRRVRFKKPVLPDEQFTLMIEREQGARGLTYMFRIVVNDELACTGVLLAEPPA